MRPKKNWQPAFVFRFPLQGVRESPTQIKYISPHTDSSAMVCFCKD